MIASPARLLVVEDDRSMTVMLRTLLEKEGYSVTTACDGQEALDILSANALPDLIVSDILMPRLDGFELLRRVRGVEEWAHVPFLFLSAMSEPEDRITGRSLGVDDYITKPFHSREFLSVVASRLARARSSEARQSLQIAEIKRQILMLLNHEFRTPLTLIVAYTKMLEEFPQRQMAREEILEFLYNISSGAQRLRRLVENFVLLVELRYSAEAEAMYTWRMRRIDDLRTLLRESLEAVSSPTDGHQFNIEADERMPQFAGDRETLIIALRELIDNAVKAAPPASTITIGAYHLDGAVVFRVIDCGPGIAPAEIDKLGEAFYQIERGKTETQGAGTGLAIVGAIAKLHSGRVTVESTPHEHTAFSIVIPCESRL
jgi:signal transduction histidine kinase